MAGLVQAGYLASSLLCIGSLSGLASQATARQVREHPPEFWWRDIPSRISELGQCQRCKPRFIFFATNFVQHLLLTCE